VPRLVRDVARAQVKKEASAEAPSPVDRDASADVVVLSALSDEEPRSKRTASVHSTTPGLRGVPELVVSRPQANQGRRGELSRSGLRGEELTVPSGKVGPSGVVVEPILAAHVDNQRAVLLVRPIQPLQIQRESRASLHPQRCPHLRSGFHRLEGLVEAVDGIQELGPRSQHRGQVHAGLLKNLARRARLTVGHRRGRGRSHWVHPRRRSKIRCRPDAPQGPRFGPGAGRPRRTHPWCPVGDGQGIVAIGLQLAENRAIRLRVGFPGGRLHRQEGVHELGQTPAHGLGQIVEPLDGRSVRRDKPDLVPLHQLDHRPAGPLVPRKRHGLGDPKAQDLPLGLRSSLGDGHARREPVRRLELSGVVKREEGLGEVELGPLVVDVRVQVRGRLPVEGARGLEGAGLLQRRRPVGGSLGTGGRDHLGGQAGPQGDEPEGDPHSEDDDEPPSEPSHRSQQPTLN